MLVYQRVPTMLYWTHRFFMFPPAWSVVVAPTTVLQRLSSSPRTNPRFVALRIFLRDTLQQLQTKLRPIAFSNNKHVPFQNSKDPMWGKNSEANTPTTGGLYLSKRHIAVASAIGTLRGLEETARWNPFLISWRDTTGPYALMGYAKTISNCWNKLRPQFYKQACFC